MPSRWPELAREMSVNLVASTTYAKGTVLGEVAATPGLFGPYVAGHTDGTQNPKAILEYACVTDGSGNISLPGEWTGSSPAAPVYIGGYFRAEELTGMDTAGLGILNGRQVQGTLTTGEIMF